VPPIFFGWKLETPVFIWIIPSPSVVGIRPVLCGPGFLSYELIMVTLWNTADHYIFILCFLYGRPT